MTTPQLPDEPLSQDVTEDVLGPKGGPGKDRKSRAFRNLTAAGIDASTANSIRHRAARLEKDPEGTRKYFKRALLVHALILDYHARNAADVDGIKAAGAGFIAVKNAVYPKGSTPKEKKK